MTVFSTAASWLQDNRLAHATVDIQYGRGGIFQPLVAWLGRTVYEDVDERGLVIRGESRDYFVAIADFSATGLVEPQVADVIREVIGVNTLEFKVAKHGNLEEYERDTHMLRYRVRTKRVSSVV